MRHINPDCLVSTTLAAVHCIFIPRQLTICIKLSFHWCKTIYIERQACMYVRLVATQVLIQVHINTLDTCIMCRYVCLFVFCFYSCFSILILFHPFTGLRLYNLNSAKAKEVVCFAAVVAQINVIFQKSTVGRN